MINFGEKAQNAARFIFSDTNLKIDIYHPQTQFYNCMRIWMILHNCIRFYLETKMHFSGETSADLMFNWLIKHLCDKHVFSCLVYFNMVLNYFKTIKVRIEIFWKEKKEKEMCSTNYSAISLVNVMYNIIIWNWINQIKHYWI